MSTLMLPLAGLTAPDPMDPAFVGDSWRTPPEVLEPVRAFSVLAGLRGEIALDPCTGPGSLVGARHEVSLPRDGLAEDWPALAGGALTWCNPPYSDPVPWMLACERQGAHGHVIALVNVATSESWWPWAPAICFWRGRVCFVSPDGARHMTNQRPSALLYWGPAPELFEHVFKAHGHVVRS